MRRHVCKDVMHTALKLAIDRIEDVDSAELIDHENNSDDSGWVWFEVTSADGWDSRDMVEVVASVIAKGYGFRLTSGSFEEETLCFNLNTDELSDEDMRKLAEEQQARAEMKHEAELDRKRERHLDRQGHF